MVAAAFGSTVMILDEPTAALGVKEGQRLCVVDPGSVSMSDAVALMTGALTPPETGMQR